VVHSGALWDNLGFRPDNSQIERGPSGAIEALQEGTSHTRPGLMTVVSPLACLRVVTFSGQRIQPPAGAR
jgi:hypothetical protein